MSSARPRHAARAERELAQLLDRLAAEGVVPGGAAAVVLARGPAFVRCFGARALHPDLEPATRDTFWDCASLTKPLVTAALLLRERALGRLRFDDSVADLVPELEAPGAPRAPTVAELLVHASGLPSWTPLYALVAEPGVPPRARWLASRREEPARAAVYGDPAYLVLGLAVERLARAPLAELAAERLWPGRDDLHLGLPSRLAGRAAPTETGNVRERELAGALAAGYEGWRTGLIRGETHDQNAHALGGAAGHAGLFGTIDGVAELARAWLLPDGAWSAEDLAELSRDQVPPSARGPQSELRTWGFQLARSRNSCAGDALSDRAFVHAGFTGTSVAVDPERGAAYVLLTNRVHPRWTPRPFHADRARFHSAAAALVESLGG